MIISPFQSLVDEILIKLGAKASLVFVQSTTQTVASALGLKLDISVPLVDLRPPAVVGLVYVNDKYLNNGFTDSEIQFILAHECAHIFNNHLISRLFWNVLEKVAKGEKNENYDMVELIKALLALTSTQHLPPNAITLRNQEYEADEIAVRLTGDLESAMSCLKKLVGNNMDNPSHAWELFDTAVPAMNMGQRIDELRRRILG